VLIAAAALSSGSAAAVDAAQAPTLRVVLARAGAYVARLQDQLAGIVAEETYLQEVRKPGAPPRVGAGRNIRELKSDLLLVRPSNADRYVEFRDVFEVNGRAVRDRQERLTALFLEPTPENRNQLRAIIDESARYNPGAIRRNVNTPMLALSFLSPALQGRFRFSVSTRREPQRPPAVADLPVFRSSTEMWVVDFRETERPTLIRTTAGANFPAAGRFWIDPATGIVLMTELAMRNRQVQATITVNYQSEALLGFHVPISMQEEYRGRTEWVDAAATYGRFRQFQVKTNEIIGKPPPPTLRPH
jgi:hypothetical protein